MHPTQNELQRFIVGRLEEEAADGVARHLEMCAACEQRAAELEAAELEAAERNTRHDPLLACLAVVAADAAQHAPAQDSAPAARRFLIRLERLSEARLEAVQGAPPAQFGEYRLGPLLGRGGMGLVFQAHHRTLDRQVAIKFVPPRLDASSRGRARFLHEARAMAKLRHARLVTALDAGCEGEWTYLVMDLLAGIDLERLLRRLSPLPLDEACELVRQTAEGLAALHAHGLVHRDLKPSNLMLVEQSAGPPTVKILDLGLSRWMPEESTGDAERDRLTLEGQWLGTLDYVAPEQLKDARRASPASDLYSLGATLHVLLTGRSIWPSDRGDPLPTRIARRLLNRPELAWEARPGLPSGLKQLAEQLMSVEPTQRPTTEQVIARLREWSELADLTSLYQEAMRGDDASADEPIPSATVAPVRSETSSEHAAPPPKSRFWRLAGAVLAAVLVGAYAWSSYMPGGKSRVESVGSTSRELDVGGMLERPAPTAAERRAALAEVLAHGGRVEWEGGDAVLTSPAELPTELPELRNLTIRGADWTALTSDKLASLLAQVGEVQHGLWLEAIDLDAAALSQITRLTSLARLNVFVVEQCDLDDPGRLSGFQHLQQIGFPNTRLSDQGLRRLVELPDLRSLDLSATSITDDGLVALADRPFEQVVVRDNRQLTDRSLIKLAGNPHLESLTLSGTRATDAVLAKLAGHRRLNGLYLAHTATTDKGLESIATIHQLNYLALNDTRVTAQGLERLTSLPLHDLWLDDLPCVDDEVVGRIAEIRSLRFVSLARTSITDRGVECFQRLPELRVLSLSGTQASDDSVRSLAACRSLQTLFLVDTLLTPAGCARVRELLPSCNVAY